MLENPFAAALQASLDETGPHSLRLDIDLDALGPSYRQSIERLGHGTLTIASIMGRHFINSDELANYIGAGDCLWDETSAAFIPPHAWVEETAHSHLHAHSRAR